MSVANTQTLRPTADTGLTCAQGPVLDSAQQANLLVAPFSFQKLAAQDFVFEMLPPALYSGTS